MFRDLDSFHFPTIKLIRFNVVFEYGPSWNQGDGPSILRREFFKIGYADVQIL
jgi:hypothetical protein